MAGYSKDFLIDAYMSRFLKCKALSVETLCRLEELAIKLYDEAGKDRFRDYASLNAEAIRVYKNEC
jgi:hypothetical protein